MARLYIENEPRPRRKMGAVLGLCIIELQFAFYGENITRVMPANHLSSVR